MNVPLGNFIGTTLLENLPYDIKSFTPIVNMAVDGSALAVKSNSPFKTVDDLIAEAKKRPKELIQGGSSFTSSRTLTGRLIQKVKGVQWNFISFKNEAEALINVLSGNVHFTITSPGVVLDHVRAGKVRVLLAAAPERYSQFKDAPTVKEAGLGEPIVIHHGILGSPNMPDYAVKKLEAAFKKVIDSDRFKKFIEDEVLQPAWMSTAEYTKLLKEETDRRKAFLIELNLLKKK
jgi:tripartite-type tricarboxylate transporter receptor subunit TctC